MPWRASKKADVWIGGRPVANVLLHNVNHGMGVGADTAVFERLDLGNTVRDVTNQGNLFMKNDVVQIGIPTTRGLTQWVHYGAIVAKDVTSSAEGDSIVYTSRFDQHMMSLPLTGTEVTVHGEPFRPVAIAGGHTKIGGEGHITEFVLNPYFEGRLIGNQIFPFNTNSGIPIHAEQEPVYLPTGMLAPFDLSTAVNFFCKLLNPRQGFVRNPTIAQLQQVLPIDFTMIRNQRFRFGMYLGEILDDLLNPHGYGWHVRHLTQATRIIEVRNMRVPSALFRLNSSATGTTFTRTDAPCVINVKADLVEQTINKVKIIGGSDRVEVTVPLFPRYAYQPDYADGKTFADFTLDQRISHIPTQTLFREFVAAPYMKSSNVWVLYGPKTGIGQVNIPRVSGTNWINSRNPTVGGLFHGAPIFDNLPTPVAFPWTWEFEPNVTLDVDGRPYGPNAGRFIEYYHPDEEAWFPIDGGPSGTYPLKGHENLKVYKNELGFTFTGNQVPQFLYNQTAKNRRPGVLQPAQVFFRITGTLKAPFRRTYEEVAQFNQNGLRDTNTLVLDMENEFPFRRSHVSSVIATGRPSTYVDSFGPMKAFAKKVLAQGQNMDVNGTVTVHGVDFWLDRYLGHGLTGIDGRNFSFNKSLSKKANYPLIDGISYDFNDQTTTLRLRS